MCEITQKSIYLCFLPLGHIEPITESGWIVIDLHEHTVGHVDERGISSDVILCGRRREKDAEVLNQKLQTGEYVILGCFVDNLTGELLPST